MLRGPSGGGKTTLLNLIGCIDSPTGGSLKLFGKQVVKRPPSTLKPLDSILERPRSA
jgi:putative ABC transport system ATP-binding protein